MSIEKPRTPPPSKNRLVSLEIRIPGRVIDNHIVPSDKIRSGVPLVVSLRRKLAPSIVILALR